MSINPTCSKNVKQKKLCSNKGHMKTTDEQA